MACIVELHISFGRHPVFYNTNSASHVIINNMYFSFTTRSHVIHYRCALCPHRTTYRKRTFFRISRTDVFMLFLDEKNIFNFPYTHKVVNTRYRLVATTIITINYYVVILLKLKHVFYLGEKKDLNRLSQFLIFFF